MPPPQRSQRLGGSSGIAHAEQALVEQRRHSVMIGKPEQLRPIDIVLQPTGPIDDSFRTGGNRRQQQLPLDARRCTGRGCNIRGEFRSSLLALPGCYRRDNSSLMGSVLGAGKPSAHVGLPRSECHDLSSATCKKQHQR
jgi:hypothetical protein